VQHLDALGEDDLVHRAGGLRTHNHIEHASDDPVSLRLSEGFTRGKPELCKRQTAR
jgi:hypothetical protein